MREYPVPDDVLSFERLVEVLEILKGQVRDLDFSQNVMIGKGKRYLNASISATIVCLSKLRVSVLMPYSKDVARVLDGLIPAALRYSVSIVEVEPYSLRMSAKGTST